MTWLALLELGSVALVGLFFLMLLAPLEALGWWSHLSDKDAQALGSLPTSSPATATPKAANHYLVFLDGIAKASKDNYDDVQGLLDRLSALMPEAVVIGTVLPYSITNRPLTRARPLARFWRLAKRRKLQNYKDPIGFSINIRNLFQVLVSADNRYGPIYNLGAARLISRALLRHGYVPGSGIALTLIGYSGGAQIAVGATPFLKHLLRAPIDVISLAGVLGADPGLSAVRFFYHLVGHRDKVAKASCVMFPGRWPLLPNSAWHRAKRRGKIRFRDMGPISHYGPGSYLDASSYLASGKSFLEHSASTIAQLVQSPQSIDTKAKRVPKSGRRSATNRRSDYSLSLAPLHQRSHQNKSSKAPSK
jgi:hypothetical protein